MRIKGRFFNHSLINIHAPINDSEEEAKDQFYEQLERAYEACPSHDVKLVMGDANASWRRGANIDSDHMLVVIKFRARQSRNH
jgi:hypothetical protein